MLHTFYNDFAKNENLEFCLIQHSDFMIANFDIENRNANYFNIEDEFFEGVTFIDSHPSKRSNSKKNQKAKTAINSRSDIEICKEFEQSNKEYYKKFINLYHKVNVREIKAKMWGSLNDVIKLRFNYF